MSDVKLCKDCRWFVDKDQTEEKRADVCLCPKQGGATLVRGTYGLPCVTLRERGGRWCGERAKWFESLSPRPRRWWQFWRCA